MIAKYSFIILTIIFSNQLLANNDYFVKKNSQAIRDSLNAIKFVNPNDAVEFSFQILENYSEKRPNRVFGSVYAALGQIYHIKGLPRQSIDYLRLAEEEFIAAIDYVPPWQIINFGNIYFANGFFDEAYKSYKRAYDLFTEFKDNQEFLEFNKEQNFMAGQATSLNNLALIEIERKNFIQAEQFFRQALEIRKLRNDKSDKPHSYLSLAELYYKWGKFGRVSTMCDSSDIAVKNYSISDKSIESRYLGMAEQYRAIFYDHIGNSIKSASSFNKALEHYEKLPIEKTRLLSIISSLKFEKGELSEALSNTNEALSIAYEQGLNREKINLLNDKKEILYKLGDLARVQGINEELLQINKANVTEQNRDMLINIELKNELSAGLALLNKQKEQRKLILAFSGLSILILGLVIFSIRNQYLASIQAKKLAEQSKLVAELELKTTERELRNVSTAIMEKNEMLESLKKDVNYASQFLSNSDSKHLIQPLKSKLDDASLGKSDWVEFKNHFDRAYPNFFDELSKINKNLTIQDLRLCAYLKSGQTTKEVAQFTGLSVRSIESRRYRLRKKLGLGRNNSLFDFIQKLKLPEVSNTNFN